MTITATSTVHDVEEVEVAQLREHLDAYLRRVADGETLCITDHGLLPRPLPLPDDGGPTLSEVLQQMRDEDDR